MIRFDSEPIELSSRLGRVGSVQPFDLWQLRENREACVEGVAQIASLSYGNEAAKNPQALFDRIVKLGHLSCLEFVPLGGGHGSLPMSSFRYLGLSEFHWSFGPDAIGNAKERHPATGFLVEAPVFVARQWMRHRSFSYLEMSRRYVKGAKVPFEFYGSDAYRDMAHKMAASTYETLIATGEPPELARSVLPVSLMTKFYVGGFDRDWCKFVELRSDPHAQPEIRVFSDFIKSHITSKAKA